MTTWIEPETFDIPQDLLEVSGGNALVAQAMFRRGVRDAQTAQSFLDPAYYQPTSGLELPGMAQAAERLEKAIYHGERICVWGDFDVDGQTSTALLVSALRQLGGDVIYHIPVRASESHGVNLPVLQQILASKEGASTRILLTCDTGVSSHEALEFSQASGIDVILTDHHVLPERLPRVLTLVNPKLLAEGHPLSTLPGVGVAYKLGEHLFQKIGDPADSRQFLDLAALGIVADIAHLEGDTRYLLQLGLQELRQAKRLGLKILMEVAELNPERLSEEHLGFILAPRLNAIGRLADANPVVELLTTADTGLARRLAVQMEGLNNKRQLLTSQVYKAALSQIENDPSLLEQGALVLWHPAWPAGVIGIVASRLVERFQVPVVLISSPAGELARGSARSVEGVDITAAIAENKEFLSGFGGHKMAAGLSISTDRLPDFRRSLGRTIRRMAEKIEPCLVIDGYVSLEELKLELAQACERLAPFGPGNPALVLACRGLTLASQATLGRNQEHALLTVEDEGGTCQRVVWWHAGDMLDSLALPSGRFDLAFSLRTSTYRGQPELQVEWIDSRQVGGVTEIGPSLKKAQVADYRLEPQPLARLRRLGGEGDLQVWAEGEAASKLRKNLASAGLSIQIANRHELTPGLSLAIWSAPPGGMELREVIERISPAHLVVFAADPGLTYPQDFLADLAGMLKYAINRQEGLISVSRLAAALGQRETAIHYGLSLLSSQGKISIIESDKQWARVIMGGSRSKSQINVSLTNLKEVLDETNAFRNFFCRAPVEALSRLF